MAKSLPAGAITVSFMKGKSHKLWKADHEPAYSLKWIYKHLNLVTQTPFEVKAILLTGI